MTVEQTEIVDVIGIDRSSGEAVLTIADHLDWDAPDDHLLTLQAKINCYIAFIESGEIHDSYPQAHGRKNRIHISFKHPLSAVATDFLGNARVVCQSANIELSWKVGL